MKNLSAENTQTRKTAKSLASAHFWPLLGLVAVAFGIPMALSMTASLLLAPLAVRIPILYEMLVIPMTVGLTILSCGLMMGLLSAMIGLCRDGEAVTVKAAFSRMRMTFKAFGLNMWLTLKTFLWMLPSYGLMILLAIGMIIMLVLMEYGIIEPLTRSDLDIFMLVFGGLMTLSTVLMLALGLPASYRYLLSLYILADKPDTRVFDCVNQSKTMMLGHKWQAFRLTIPLILTMLVMMLVACVAAGAPMTMAAASPLLVVLLRIALAALCFGILLHYMARMYLCTTIFYLKRAKEQPTAEEPALVEDTIPAE